MPSGHPDTGLKNDTATGLVSTPRSSTRTATFSPRSSRPLKLLANGANLMRLQMAGSPPRTSEFVKWVSWAGGTVAG
jgi:hypothetical protein